MPLQDFIDKARAKGWSDDDIRKKLLKAGWVESDVDDAIDDLVVPTPDQANGLVVPSPVRAVPPVAVVNNFSTRGLEYAIMFLSLWAASVSIGFLAHNFVSNLFSVDRFSSYGTVDTASSFATTVLVVTAPIFIALFLRLKKAEFSDSSLRLDTSRTKLTQLTQLVAFVMGVGYLIYFVYKIITPEANSSYSYEDGSIGEQFLHMLITLFIAGGIFAYYWIDGHRGEQA